jgi:hypothetical protein
VFDCGWIKEFEKNLPEKHKGYNYSNSSIDKLTTGINNMNLNVENNN